MYSKHPWPVNRRTAEEMGWRLRVLGIHPSEYRGRRVLECGCGTGNYVIWYAIEGGASEAVGIDLSEGSLAVANRLKEEGQVGNAAFLDFRKTRRLAELPIALLRPVLDQYEPVFQPNAFLNELPETYKEAGALVRMRMQGG